MKTIYCHCSFAKIIDEKVKKEVLEGLSESGKDITLVPDLCQSSAQKDPRLSEWLDNGPACVIACYERSIKWLAHNVGIDIDTENIKVLNMREQNASEILEEMNS